MASFDTLIRRGTLASSSSAGSNRQNTDREVKIQNDNSFKYPRKGVQVI